jgi:Ca2+/H+ antiporter
MNNKSLDTEEVDVIGVSHVQMKHSYVSFQCEAQSSLRLMMTKKLNILLLFGPLAMFGSSTGAFGEFFTFLFAGLALIPCAERLSFVTEQVAEHTNETIGALLNATFGNAPEFLISSAALRSGFYRVVQLTLLGSMLTNLLFVFGLSCFIGGLQWQTQELRITSGNVSIGMLLIAVLGIILPAVLKLADESMKSDVIFDIEEDSEFSLTKSDVGFSRINALVMVTSYVAYLVFQLGSHKEEFDYEGEDYAHFGGGHNVIRTPHAELNKVPPSIQKHSYYRRNKFFEKCLFMRLCPKDPSFKHAPTREILEKVQDEEMERFMDNPLESPVALQTAKRRKEKSVPQSLEVTEDRVFTSSENKLDVKSKISDIDDEIFSDNLDEESEDETMSIRMGLIWLGIITAIISVLSDIIVETIDGFAARSKMSEVFTSVIIIPYFSNIGECRLFSFCSSNMHFS